MIYKDGLRTRDVTWKLRTRAADSGNPRFHPITCTRLPVTHVLGDSTLSFSFCGYSCMWYIYTHSGKCKEKINGFLKRSIYWVGFKAVLFFIRNYKLMKGANFFSSQPSITTSQVHYCQSDFDELLVPTYLQGIWFLHILSFLTFKLNHKRNRKWCVALKHFSPSQCEPWLSQTAHAQKVTRRTLWHDANRISSNLQIWLRLLPWQALSLQPLPPLPLHGQFQSALPEMTAYEFIVYPLPGWEQSSVCPTGTCLWIGSKWDIQSSTKSRFLRSERSWKEAEAVLEWLSCGIHRYCQNNIQPSDGKSIWRWHH